MSLFLFSLSSLIELKKVCQRKVNLIHFLLSIAQRLIIVRASVQSDFNLFDTYLIEKKVMRWLVTHSIDGTVNFQFDSDGCEDNVIGKERIITNTFPSLSHVTSRRGDDLVLITR